MFKYICRPKSSGKCRRILRCVGYRTELGRLADTFAPAKVVTIRRQRLAAHGWTMNVENSVAHPECLRDDIGNPKRRTAVEPGWNRNELVIDYTERRKSRIGQVNFLLIMDNQENFGVQYRLISASRL